MERDGASLVCRFLEEAEMKSRRLMMLGGMVLVFVLSSGCTPQAAKKLSYNVRQATAHKKEVDKEIYRELVRYIRSDFQQHVQVAKQRLHARYQERLRDARERLEAGFWRDYDREAKLAEEDNKELLEELETRKSEELDKLLVASNDKERQRVRLEFTQLELDIEGVHRQVAEHKEELLLGLREMMEENFKVVKTAYDTALAEAETHISQQEKAAEHMATGIEDLVGELEKLDAAIAEGSARIDEYIQRKSKLGLVTESFFQKLGIQVSPDKIDGLVNKAGQALSDRLNGGIDKFLTDTPLPSQPAAPALSSSPNP